MYAWMVNALNESIIYGLDDNLITIPFAIERIFDTFKLLEIQFSGNCRQKRFSKNIINYLQDKDYDIHEILEGYKDFRELNIISKASIELSNSKINNLKRIVEGQVLPINDRNPDGRNFQYEFVMASYFHLSGFKVILEEPDFSFVFHGRKYPVAVKRLSSKNRIGKNIHKGEHQIENTGGFRGFICLSLDMLFPDVEKIISFDNPDKSIRYARELIEFVVRLHFNSQHFIRRDKVLGIIATLAFPFKLKGKELGYANYHMFFPLGKEGSSEWNEVIAISDFFHYNRKNY